MEDATVAEAGGTPRLSHWLPGTVLLVWGLRWGLHPVILLLAMGQGAGYGHGPIPLALVGLGWWIELAVCVGALTCGSLLLAMGRRAARATAVVLAMAIAYQIIFVLLPAWRAIAADLSGEAAGLRGLLAALESQVALGDVGCAAALLWFIARTSAATPEAASSGTGRRIAPAVTLAVLVLVFREGMQAPLTYLDVAHTLRQDIGSFHTSAAHVLTLGAGIVASVGAVLLVAALVLRWRGLVPGTFVLMLLAMVRLVAALFVPWARVNPESTLDGLAHVEIWATAATGVAEYLLLIAAIAASIAPRFGPSPGPHEKPVQENRPTDAS